MTAAPQPQQGYFIEERDLYAEHWNSWNPAIADYGVFLSKDDAQAEADRLDREWRERDHAKEQERARVTHSQSQKQHREHNALVRAGLRSGPEWTELPDFVPAPMPPYTPTLREAMYVVCDDAVTIHWPSDQS